MIDEKKLLKEIKGWQEDINDNEFSANKFDFVFERIYEILNEQPKVGEWIPFDEIKPMHNQYVLSIDSNGEMEVMYFDKEWENCLCKWNGSLKTFNIVAWMPLPKAYEVQDD